MLLIAVNAYGVLCRFGPAPDTEEARNKLVDDLQVWDKGSGKLNVQGYEKVLNMTLLCDTHTHTHTHGAMQREAKLLICVFNWVHRRRTPCNGGGIDMSKTF
jgi:hypothetical protein